MINISTLSVLDLLPDNMRNDPTIAPIALSIDAELQKLTSDIEKLTYVNRLDSLSSSEVDELAWQYHVDYYDASLPIQRRRELVKNSLSIHQRKGTKEAVEELITTIFGDGEVEEWFEYGGDPGRFRVITSNQSLANELAQQFVDALNTVKNVRSHMDPIQMASPENLNLYYGGAVRTGDFTTVRQVG